MANNGVYADYVVVSGIASMLRHDILIVTNVPSAGDSTTWIKVANDFNGEPISLGHIHENHYQSVQPKGKNQYHNTHDFSLIESFIFS